MTAITLKGAKITRLSFERENSEIKISGSYDLLSSHDMVLAKQTFGGYSDVKLLASPQSQRLLGELMASLSSDLNNTMGLDPQ